MPWGGGGAGQGQCVWVAAIVLRVAAAGWSSSELGMETITILLMFIGNYRNIGFLKMQRLNFYVKNYK